MIICSLYETGSEKTTRYMNFDKDIWDRFLWRRAFLTCTEEGFQADADKMALSANQASPGAPANHWAASKYQFKIPSKSNEISLEKTSLNTVYIETVIFDLIWPKSV